MIVGNAVYLLTEARPGRGIPFLIKSDKWEHPNQSRHNSSRRMPVKERHDYRPWQCTRVRSIREMPIPASEF